MAGEEKREACGLVAIISKKEENVAAYLYRAMTALQHRGQDAAGFVLSDNGKWKIKKGLGYVGEVFSERDMKLEGSSGIGHTRYPTTGRCEINDVQPFIHEKIAIAHNGQIANYKELEQELKNEGYALTSTVDSEIFAVLMQKKIKKGLFYALKEIFQKTDGAYSVVGLIDDVIIAFRDPNGLRPLVWGENERFFCFASESAALDSVGVRCNGDVKPGECIVVDCKGRVLNKKQICNPRPGHCMFEYVYFSRPDSVINGKWVFEIRKKLGELLAAEQPVDADVVVPVPDTARTAADAFARKTGIPMEEGLIKNRYIGRTFIMPSQDERVASVRLKLNAVKPIIEGKRIVLVDDSIVRGTTLKEIVSLVRGADAKEVHLRITCPPIIAPCFYGVNMSTFGQLVAYDKKEDEIRKFLGADSLGYLSINGLKKAIGLQLCTGCLDQNYPTAYVRKLAKEQEEKEKS